MQFLDELTDAIAIELRVEPNAIWRRARIRVLVEEKGRRNVNVDLGGDAQC